MSMNRLFLPKAPCPRCGAICNAAWIEHAGYCTHCHKLVHGPGCSCLGCDGATGPRDVGEKTPRQKARMREWDRGRKGRAA